MHDNKALCEEAISLSLAILDGRCRILLGVRKLVPYLHELDLAIDERFTSFIGIDSDTDGLPLEDRVRKLWNKEALSRLDKAADDYEEQIKSGILADCRVLIEELQKRKNK